MANATLMTVPALGIGEAILVLHEEVQPTPENGEVLWAPSEIDAFHNVLEKAPQDARDMWIQYIDVVKRMYPGAKLVSISPLRIEHPDLTQEMLEAIPWKLLPRR